MSDTICTVLKTVVYLKCFKVVKIIAIINLFLTVFLKIFSNSLLQRSMVGCNNII